MESIQIAFPKKLADALGVDMPTFPKEVAQIVALYLVSSGSLTYSEAAILAGASISDLAEFAFRRPTILV